MSNRKRGFPTSAASCLSGRWGAYRSVQVLLASRLRVQRYGGLRHYTRKHMKKVVVFVKNGHFSAFPLCKPNKKKPFSGISKDFSDLPGALRQKNGGDCPKTILSNTETLQSASLLMTLTFEMVCFWRQRGQLGTTWFFVVNVVLVVLVVVLSLTTTGTTGTTGTTFPDVVLVVLVAVLFDDNRNNLGQLFLMLSWLPFYFWLQQGQR